QTSSATGWTIRTNACRALPALTSRPTLSVTPTSPVSTTAIAASPRCTGSNGARPRVATPCRARLPRAPERLRSAKPLPGLPVVLALDQFDLVAVRIGDEGDHRGAALHRPRLACDVAAGRADAVTSGVDVVHPQRDVAVGAAQI